MTDLFSLKFEFSNLKFFYSDKLNKDDFSTRELAMLEWQAISFNSILELSGAVILLHDDDLKLLKALKKEERLIFFLSLSDVPEEYHELVYSIKGKESHEYYELFNIFDKLISQVDQKKIIANSYIALEKYLKRAQLYQSNQNNEPEGCYLEILKTYIENEERILKKSSFKQFLKKIEKCFEAFELFYNLKIICFEDISSNEKGLIFPLSGQKYFLYFETNKPDEDLTAFAFGLILDWVERFLILYDQSGKTEKGLFLWEEAFSSVPVATALLSFQGDLILHNEKFSFLEILPSECLRREDGQKVEIKGQTYKVAKISIDDELSELFLILFYRDQDFVNEDWSLKTVSGQELGIISSSIAHELNNPLAGILAAISLLELENKVGDNKLSLEEMRESAKRCKNLVEIFLGFSKAGGVLRLEKNSSCSARDAFDQALDLLRFRMIEANHKLKVQFEEPKQECSFNKPVNLSIMTMVFYLILGEVLTQFAHLGLVREDKEENALRVLFAEERDRIFLKFEDESIFLERILEFKLIRYLVDLEGLSLDVKEESVFLTEWKLT